MSTRFDDPPVTVTACPDVMATCRSVPGAPDMIGSPLPLALTHDRVVPAEAAS